MVIKVQLWKDADGPSWSQYEFMSNLYQDTWMDISTSIQTIEIWI